MTETTRLTPAAAKALLDGDVANFLAAARQYQVARMLDVDPVTLAPVEPQRTYSLDSAWEEALVMLRRDLESAGRIVLQADVKERLVPRTTTLPPHVVLTVMLTSRPAR